MTDPSGILATRLEVLHNDVSEIKDALKTLSDAITKLALVEERQTETTKALERCFKGLEKLEVRVAAVERVTVNASRTSQWVDKVVLGAVILVMLFVAKKVGLS